MNDTPENDKYELGHFVTSGTWSRAVRWPDGRIECGPTAERLHEKADAERAEWVRYWGR